MNLINLGHKIINLKSFLRRVGIFLLYEVAIINYTDQMVIEVEAATSSQRTWH